MHQYSVCWISFVGSDLAAVMGLASQRFEQGGITSDNRVDFMSDWLPPAEWFGQVAARHPDVTVMVSAATSTPARLRMVWRNGSRDAGAEVYEKPPARGKVVDLKAYREAGDPYLSAWTREYLSTHDEWVATSAAA